MQNRLTRPKRLYESMRLVPFDHCDSICGPLADALTRASVLEVRVYRVRDDHYHLRGKHHVRDLSTIQMAAMSADAFIELHQSHARPGKPSHH